MTTRGVETFSYDGRGLMQMYRDAYHATGNPTAWYQYDALDRLSDVTDALGSGPGDPNHTTNYQYNSRNQVTTTTHPVDPGSVGATAGRRYTVVNDYNMADGTLKRVTDELQHVTSFTYDNYRRLRSVTTPGHNTPLTATVCYDAKWQCVDDYTLTDTRPTTVLSPGGKPVYSGYDDNRRLLAVTVGSGAEGAGRYYYYDWNGNYTGVAGPNEQYPLMYYGKRTVINYDERNRPMSMTDDLGNPTTFTYDAGGRKASITRANGQVTTFDDYDAMNRLWQQTVTQNPSPGAVTQYGYYKSGLLAGIRDPHLTAIGSSDCYSWVYDLMGRKTQANYPLVSGGVRRLEVWHYDTAGRVDKFTNRAGSIETPTWDALSRLTNTSWNDGITPSVSAHYDVVNRPVNVANANATVGWTYFNDGLINTETLTALNDAARTVTYQYNADSLRSNITYPGPAPVPAFSYNYTSRNQLDNSSDNSAMQWVKYLYDLDGNRQHRKLHNGATDTVYGTADPLDRIPSISTAFTSGGTASFNYAFDAVSRLQYEQRNGGVADGYTYDQADQIIGFNRGGTLQNGTVSGGAEIMSLTFDANGNRVTTNDNNVMKSYAVNELNQYTQDLNGAPTYDVNGNLATTGDGWAYKYDAQNRLTHADQSSTNTHVIYYYDPLNRQVARDENNVRTYSVWDGWSLIQEYDGSGNLLNNYLQGADMDEVVARFGTSNTNRLWYYQDGRGNTSHVADDTGALVETYTYDLGGKPFITTAAGKTSPKNRLLYNGRDYSSFTGLYDFRNRFYHPATSRFIQSDPIGFAGGNHLYRFGGNSAVNTGDPLGLQVVQRIWYDPPPLDFQSAYSWDFTSYSANGLAGPLGVLGSRGSGEGQSGGSSTSQGGANSSPDPSTAQGGANSIYTAYTVATLPTATMERVIVVGQMTLDQILAQANAYLAGKALADEAYRQLMLERASGVYRREWTGPIGRDRHGYTKGSMYHGEGVITGGQANGMQGTDIRLLPQHLLPGSTLVGYGGSHLFYDRSLLQNDAAKFEGYFGFEPVIVIESPGYNQNFERPMYSCYPNPSCQ